MTRIIHDSGAQFCPDCGARLDAGEPLPPADCFDDTLHAIVIDGEFRHLPPRVWRLLSLLRRRAPRIVRRPVLMDALECLDGSDAYQGLRNGLWLLRRGLKGTPYGIKSEFAEGCRLVEMPPAFPQVVEMVRNLRYEAAQRG